VTERIALISTSYPRQPGDAAGHFVYSEAQLLARAGHEVHVFAPGTTRATSGDGVSVHWLSDQGAFGWPGAMSRLKERPVRWLGAGSFALRAQRALARCGPFARIQAHFLVPCAWPIATLAVSGSRADELELVGHGSDVRLFCRLPSALRAHIARTWLARGARLRLTSAALASQLRAANPELAGALCVEASPIDVVSIESRDTTRQALAIPTSTQLALIVSRLIPEKRVALALRALSLIDNLTVIVVGDGPERARLQARFPEVRFVGYLPRPETLSLIGAADVLVSASEHEGAPSVVREARALGVPVVATRAGDLATWAGRDPGLLVVGGGSSDR
jgi:teichuronic acid biosynthesis glycosyltransferase TuaC